MNSKKEEKKSLNYNFEQNKDFSFRNDDINDENQNPNKTLISSGRQSYSNSKNSIQINFDNDNNLFQKNKKVKKPNNMDLLNQLVVNRLIQENKYLKQELEMAKSNILILEEKESQYKSTIEHINNMNNGKEISHKNIISLINNYKKRENEFKQIIKDSKNNFAKKENELNTKILILQKKFNKNDKIIKELRYKLNGYNDQIKNLQNIINEKNKIINILSQKRKKSYNFQELSLQEINNLQKSKSFINLINTKGENNSQLLQNEKTLSHLNLNNYDFNFSNSKKNSNEQLKTLNNGKFYQKLKINNYLTDNTNYNSNTEVNNNEINFSKAIRKHSAFLNKNNISQGGNNMLLLRKNNSFLNVGRYNSVNSTINKNNNNNYYDISSNNLNTKFSIDNSVNLVQNKKILNKKLLKNLKINSDRREIKKLIMLSPTNRRTDIKIKTNENNNMIDMSSYSFLSNDNGSYRANDNHLNKNNFNKNNKNINFDKKYFIDKYNNNNENIILNTNSHNDNKKNRMVEINNFFLNNKKINANSPLRSIITEKNKIF